MVATLIIMCVVCARLCVFKMEDRKLPVESSEVKCFVISLGKLVQQLQSDHHFYVRSPSVLSGSSFILMSSLSPRTP